MGYWSGKHHSEETKIKLRLARLGKKKNPHSEETKRKIGRANSISCKGKPKPWLRVPRVVKFCKTCGTKFEVYLRYSNLGYGIFCSQGCFGKDSKGKKKSLEAREKMKGRKSSEEAKRKMSISQFGSKGSNWKGGITPLYKDIRTLLEARKWREEVFKRDNYTCQECYSVGHVLNAHHKNKSFSKLLSEFLKEYNQFSPIEDKETLARLAQNYKPFWDVENGQTLCEDCHNKTKVFICQNKTG